MPEIAATLPEPAFPPVDTARLLEIKGFVKAVIADQNPTLTNKQEVLFATLERISKRKKMVSFLVKKAEEVHGADIKEEARIEQERKQEELEFAKLDEDLITADHKGNVEENGVE